MAQKTYIVAAISTAVNRCWSCGLSEILNLELPASNDTLSYLWATFPSPYHGKAGRARNWPGSCAGLMYLGTAQWAGGDLPPHVLTRQYGSCAYCCQ